MKLGTALFISVAWALLALGASPTPAAEYFVSKQGSDEHDGRTQQTAFLTIQRGVGALEAGDTLTIAPGEYRESVKREGLGNGGSDTTIRAAIPGTVLLRGDVPAPEFQKVEGYRFIYVAAFDGDAQTVNEVDTLKILEAAPSVPDLEFAPGYYYDTEAQKLYISTSDLQPPSRHHYTVSVTPDHGLYLEQATRVAVEGLAATGFHSAEQKEPGVGYRVVWGIILGRSHDSVIRHCTAFFNSGGIAFDNTPHNQTGRSGNLIEYCRAYANDSRHGGEGGNIVMFSPDHDTISQSYAYGSRLQGIRLYGNVTGPAIAHHNLAWGNESGDIWIKGGAASQYGVVENSVSLGDLSVAATNNNIYNGRNRYNSNPGSDDIRLQDEPKLDRSEEFADPTNLDFRLQATSRFHGSGPDGSDRGPFPYEPNIHYVTPEGDDSSDGLSVRHAWRTLSHALAQLEAGDTLYLAGGTYSASTPLAATGTESEPINIRGRGEDHVIIAGGFRLAGVAHVTFERLHFNGPVEVEGSEAVTFNNCIFQGMPTSLKASGSPRLRVTHSLFFGFEDSAVALSGSEGAYLSGNIYGNQHGPALTIDDASAVRYANYNSYQNPDVAWSVTGRTMPLASLQPERETQARFTTPELAFEDGAVRLGNAHAFAGRGPLGTAIGLYHEFRKRDMRLEGPFVHSVSDTTANVEWWSSVPARFEIGWGETPECTNRERLEVDQFASLSLTDLKPGQKYYFKIISATPTQYMDAIVTRGIAADASPIAVATDKTAAKARVYYVANDGDDQNSGLSRGQAWRTVGHAATRANAGDTVMLAGGTYSEGVHVRATGAPGKPITFTPVPGERVVFDGNGRIILTAFRLTNKHHINIDGFYFIDYGMHRREDGVISVNDSDHVRITRCFLNGKGAGYQNPFIYSTGNHLLVRNCVTTNAFSGMLFHGEGPVRVEHNVFVRNMIHAVMSTAADVQVHHNIIMDSKESKVRVALMAAGYGALNSYKIHDNAFFLRQPDEQRELFVFWKDGSSYGYGSPERFSVAEYEQHTGNASNLVVDPQFQIAVGQEPTDKKGKKLEYLGDWVYGQDFDFPDLFTTHPELVERGIGLVPADFEDFHFNRATTAGSEN